MTNGTTAAKNFAWDALHTELQSTSKQAGKVYKEIIRLNQIMDADYAVGEPTEASIVSERKELLAQLGHIEAKETELTKILNVIEQRMEWSDLNDK